FIRKEKEPDLIVTLLEDTAALAGLLFAFIGVGLAEVTGNEAWDGGGSVAIGLPLARGAFVVARETKSLLIGEAASDVAERTIVRALEDGPELERVIHLRTVHLSPDSLLVTAKVAIRKTDTAESIVRGIAFAEIRVRPALPTAHVIYLEPAIYRESQVDETDPAIRTVHRAWGDYTGPDYPRGTGPLPEQPGPEASAPEATTPTGESQERPAPAGAGPAPARSPGPGPAARAGGPGGG